MKPIITKFNDKTGDFEITIPVPFSLKDGIEYVDMAVADIPKYEDIKDYNVFDLIRENQELKEQLEEINNFINKASFVNIEQLMLDYCAKVEQQKEFINYLESESKELIRDAGYHQRICLEILEKYKEIIGGKHE